MIKNGLILELGLFLIDEFGINDQQIIQNLGNDSAKLRCHIFKPHKT